MAETTWTYDESRRVFTVRYRGRLTLDVFQEVREVRRSLGIEQGAVRILIDAREADLSELTADDFKALERIRESDLAGEAERAAGVVGRESDLGIAELWAFYRNRSVPGSTAVFLSLSEAIEWLVENPAERRQGLVRD